MISWENKFAEEFRRVCESNRQAAGVLLPLIPNHDEWQEFLTYIREKWSLWKGYLAQEWPHCLVVLYGGLAFYEYNEGKFWPQLAEAVGCTLIDQNDQRNINQDFEKATQELGLKILKRDSGADYVGSAVYHIGIPLSLWDDFLDVCEWSLRCEEWEFLPPDKWVEVMSKLSGGRQRLKRFLVDNRDAAAAFIKEMCDARRILSEDEAISLDNLKQVCLLRQEYFDEVPETADFLRPTNPDSLFKDRARLIWDDQRCSISLNLPPVATAKLPAVWSIGNLSQSASSMPYTFPINSAAFVKSLLVKLESGAQTESLLLPGIGQWGLFDSQRNRFANLKREQLPIGRYVIISSKKLEDVSRKGFEEDEYPANDPCELEDSTICYITQLWPTDKSAEVSFKHDGAIRKIGFRPGLKIEARIFAGEGSRATSFSRYQEWIKVERLPLLCLAVPFGSFDQTDSALQYKFQVCLGDQPMEGFWEKRHEDEFQEFYVWRWKGEPQPRKKVSVSITALALGIKFDYQIEMLLSKLGLSDSWESLPGAFLPMCLLAQPAAGMKEGMKWEDLLLAKEAIAPEGYLSRYVLRQYTNFGLLDYTGHRWVIADSRAKFEMSDSSGCIMSYCGNPAILWGLFRYIYDQVSDVPMPKIEVINNRSELPYLLIRWHSAQAGLVRKYFNQRQHNVRIVSDLWRP